MIDDITRQLDALRASLRSLYKKIGPGAEQSKQAISLLEETQQLIRNRIRGDHFVSPADEIRYFRHLKPLLTSKLIYHHRIYHLELETTGMPEEQVQQFLRRENEKIIAFYIHNAEFIRYIRSGDTVLDNVYFLRNKLDFRRMRESIFVELDPEQTTLYDHKLAKLYAYDQLNAYLRQRMDQSPDEEAKDPQQVKSSQMPEPVNLSATRWLKSHQVERLLGISSTTLMKLRQMGEVPCRKIGGVYYYEEQEILKWMKGHR